MAIGKNITDNPEVQGIIRELGLAVADVETEIGNNPTAAAISGRNRQMNAETSIANKQGNKTIIEKLDDSNIQAELREQAIGIALQRIGNVAAPSGIHGQPHARDISQMYLDTANDPDMAAGEAPNLFVEAKVAQDGLAKLMGDKTSDVAADVSSKKGFPVADFDGESLGQAHSGIFEITEKALAQKNAAFARLRGTEE